MSAETTEAKIYYCPFPGCPWAHVSAPGPEESEGALADVFGPGVFGATARYQRLAMTEQTLGAHLGSHATGDWAIALFQANADRDQATAAERERIIALASRLGATIPADHPQGARASFADFLRVTAEEGQ